MTHFETLLTPQEISHHLAFALDLHWLALLEAIFANQLSFHSFGNLYAVHQSVAFPPDGVVYNITPEIVDKLLLLWAARPRPYRHRRWS